jgi:Protein of unknown function (DUF2934)
MKPKTTTEDTVHKEHGAAESESIQPERSHVPSPEEIRQRAYELHLEGGCVHRRDLDDRFQAERDLKGR